MKIVDCKQHSTEWAQTRLGVITASEADALLTPLFKISEGKSVETYLCKKLSEKLLGYALDTGGTFAMSQGNTVEEIARPWFAFTYDVDVRTVGLCLTDDGRCGASPDGLLPDGSGLEIKSPSGPVHLKYYFHNELPPEHKVQVHFSMYVTNAPYWTFVSFHRALPPLVLRVERDEKIIATIRTAVAAFTKDFDDKLAKIEAVRAVEDAPKQAAHEAAVREFERTGKAP